jgi:hypothetical protein
MNVVYPNLHKAMLERGVTVNQIAEAVSLSEDIVHLKLLGVREWSLLEAVTICRLLQYSDLKQLFLR